MAKGNNMILRNFTGLKYKLMCSEGVPSGKLADMQMCRLKNDRLRLSLG